METELVIHGITIIGFSSDGDSRLLKAMRSQSMLSCYTVGPVVEEEENLHTTPSSWQEFFAAKYVPKVLCVQDTVHIGTKLRTR